MHHVTSSVVSIFKDVCLIHPKQLTLCYVDGLELMFVGIGFVTVPLAIIIYTRINKKRDALEKEMKEKGIKLSPDEIRRLGDRAPDFRYTL